MTEAILEPDLPIIDPHHHLWDLRRMVAAMPDPEHPMLQAMIGAPYYTFDELQADTGSGHHIIGTVFLECSAFYKAGAEEAMKPVGEVEFVNGVAAQGASGLYGEYRPCAGIVGHADMTLGDSAVPVLEALAAAGGGRFRGIRHAAAWDADADLLGFPMTSPQGLLASDVFRSGFAHLAKQDLTFDCWVLEPQLGDVIDLARAFPDQRIVLNHCGTPLNIGGYKGTLAANFDRWRRSIQLLAECPNVFVKLGGLAMAFCGMPQEGPAKGTGSEALATMWRPYIETCIEAFGAERAMFESNYPVDRWGATYPVLWNAFKRITSGASDDEKRWLYAGAAADFYTLDHLLG